VAFTKYESRAGPVPEKLSKKVTNNFETARFGGLKIGFIPYVAAGCKPALLLGQPQKEEFGVWCFAPQPNFATSSITNMDYNWAEARQHKNLS